jgi:hypothetical protein
MRTRTTVVSGTLLLAFARAGAYAVLQLKQQGQLTELRGYQIRHGI